MSFGKRVSELRKQHKISQEELSKKIGVHQNVIGRYEREEAKPSIDIATKLADIFNVSLDYLVGKTTVKVDKSILKRVLDVQQMDTEDKEHILYTIDALIKNVKFKSL